MNEYPLIINTAINKAFTFFAALSFFLLLTCAGFSQTKSPIEGVWKIAEYIRPGKSSAEKDTTITDPQPGLFIFTRNYFSQTFVMGDRPRAAVAAFKDRQNPTDAEKIARYEQWRQFAANAGTYEINGSTIIFHASVAKNVNIMNRGGSHTLVFTLEDPNTLWLIPTAEESAIEPRIKLIRQE